MIADDRLQSASRAARRRRFTRVLVQSLPVVAVAAALAARFSGAGAAFAVAGLGFVLAAAWAQRATRAIDARWLARRLDRRADMEDSAELLFADPARLGGLAGLQRERLATRLVAGPAPDLREPWPTRALAGTWTLAALLVAALWGWPASAPETTDAAADPAPVAAETATHVELTAARLDITPPAYTGQPARSGNELSAKLPEGARLQWTLRFSPVPDAVELAFHDGSRLPLTREGEDWVGTRVLLKPALYRIQATAALPQRDERLHRLDVVADQPPQLRVIAPERSLSLRSEGQRDWSLDFEASDDHGLGPARLVVTLAQGSGEQVTVKEQVLALRGEGEPRLKRYTRRLDLGALGLAEGDDLIVRLELRDNRAPSPQAARSASLILRWPLPPATEATGMEGLVKRALPAYFRSQRQIILDAEALLAERGRLPADDFAARSDSLGVDQRILRMRYGQFLGEENAGQPEPPPGAGEGDDGHSAGDGHDHEGEPPTASAREINVLEDYGHTHDDAEAATLLDPETRALLKQALDAMWSSEGELRQGQPARALPHAYRALGFIKQVQQATRIYLARVGLELPPIDESRRMGGDRAGLGDRRHGLVAATVPESPARALWQALAGGAATQQEYDDFAAWLRDNEGKLEDALGVVAALEAARTDAACADCRRELRARLWPLLPTPAAAPAARPVPDAVGEAYLDALSREPSP